MRIAIIGGGGQMGEWFSGFFKNAGYEVVISGRRYGKCVEVSRKLGVKAVRRNTEAVNGADIIMISVLPQHMENVLKEIAPHILENQKIIDIASVKAVPVRLMHTYARNALVLGTHPMFGPSAMRENQNFILTPTSAREKKYASEFGKFLKKHGFKVRIMSPEDHDSMIGDVLSLTHFIGLVTADTWKRLGVDKHMKTSSTSFRFLSDFVKSVVDSNPGLYSYLQMEVPDTEKAERTFIESANRWAELVKSKNRKKFSTSMTTLSRYVNKIQRNWK